MSEMADTLTTNMKMLSLTDKTTLLSIERVSAYQKKLAPLLKYLENLNSKSNENTTSERDVKGVLKFLVGTDEETDALIDEAMEVGTVLFLTATHLTVARTLFHNPAKYAKIIENSSEWARHFKSEGTMKSLKMMLDKQCCPSSSSARSRSVTPQCSQLLAELVTSDEESQSADTEVEDVGEEEQPPVEARKRKREIEIEPHKHGSTKKKKKSKKQKRNNK